MMEPCNLIYFSDLSKWSEDLRREDGSAISVGDRVDSDGYFATVKYIGFVPPTKGSLLTNIVF